MPINLNHKSYFWTVIQQAKRRSGRAIDKSLYRQFKKMGPNELIEFQSALDYYLGELNSKSVWIISYIINRGPAQDGYLYFRLWLISHGYTIFEKIMLNTDSITHILESSDGEVWSEYDAYLTDLMERRGLESVATGVNSYIDMEAMCALYANQLLNDYGKPNLFDHLFPDVAAWANKNLQF